MNRRYLFRQTTMKETIPMKTITNITYPAIAVIAFACFAVSPGARAVSPAPDGGYPGGNTAEGDSALLSLTTGGYNTAVGWSTLENTTNAGFNTAMLQGGTAWRPDGRNVSPLSPGATLAGTSPTALLNSFNNLDPNGTWTLYLADLSGGGQATPAHRVSWELHRGPLAPRQQVHHACGNRACVRPEHLHASPPPARVA